MMDPWTIGGMIGLFNGLVGRESSEAMQEKQMAFQMAMQQRQMQQVAQLQNEMRELAAKEATQARQDSFMQQERMLTMQAFLNKWPMNTPPDVFLRRFAECEAKGQQPPMHLMIARSASLRLGAVDMAKPFDDAVKSLAVYISEHYSLNGKQRPVQILDNIFNTADIGASEILMIHQIFRYVPTIILIPRVSEGNYILTCAMCGIGDMENHELREIYRCNAMELYYATIQRECDHWQAIKQGLPENLEMEGLCQVMKELNEAKENNRHLAPEDFEKYVLPAYNKRIEQYKNTFATPVFKACVGMIKSSCKVISTLVADAYYLMDRDTPPLFPRLCSEEIKESPLLMQTAVGIFRNMIEAAPSTTKAPLRHARLCTAYHEGGLLQEAVSEYEKGETALRQLWQNPEEKEWLLLDDLSEGVQLLHKQNVLKPHSSLKKYADILQENSPQTMYEKGAEYWTEPKQQEKAMPWFQKAADAGYGRAAFTMGRLHEKGLYVQQDPRLAAAYYRTALKQGVKQALPFTPYVAKQLIREKQYIEAFTECLDFLSATEDKNVRDELSAIMCALILSEASSSLPTTKVRDFLQHQGIDLRFSTSPVMSAIGIIEAETQSDNLFTREVYTALLLNQLPNCSMSLLAESDDLYPHSSVPDFGKSKDELKEFIEYNIRACEKNQSCRYNELRRLYNEYLSAE